MNLRKSLKASALLFIAFLCITSCMKLESIDEEQFDSGNIPSGDGLFIVNEGNFMYGTASLSFYVPSEKSVTNEVFARANSLKLGDVAQSMTIYDGRGYIAVNNSGVVFVIDINTFKVTGVIKGLVSPRYIHFVSESKAYITDLYSSSITVFNPVTLEKTTQISTGGHTSTEQMVQYGKYVFTNCWSYDNKILVIDTDTDQVVDEIEVGLQPTSLVIDKNNKIWTITDGGYEGSPYGWEASALYRIDAETRTVEKKFIFERGDHGSELCINGQGDEIYFINKLSVWRMPVTADMVPVRPFIESPTDRKTIFYGLGVNPLNSEVYIADAIDYQQAGIIYRYSADGELLDNFKVGIIPGGFCFK